MHQRLLCFWCIPFTIFYEEKYPAPIYAFSMASDKLCELCRKKIHIISHGKRHVVFCETNAHAKM